MAIIVEDKDSVKAFGQYKETEEKSTEAVSNERQKDSMAGDKEAHKQGGGDTHHSHNVRSNIAVAFGN